MTFYNDSFAIKDFDSIYTSLASISSGGRKYVKNVAQSLVDMQKNAGDLIPDGFCQDNEGNLLEEPDKKLVYKT